MSTYNHTAITYGASAASSVVNAPLGQLDAAIGDLTALTTTAKGSAVAALNELVASLAASAGTTANAFEVNNDKSDANADLVLGRTTGGDATIRWNGTNLTLRPAGNEALALSYSGGAKIGFLGATPALRQAHIADPSGGATEDAEARAAINAILAVLETFGLVATS